MWGHKIYTIWTILFIVFIILNIVTAFITIALTYFQLAVEDHAWWWRSFLCGGSTGEPAELAWQLATSAVGGQMLGGAAAAGRETQDSACCFQLAVGHHAWWKRSSSFLSLSTAAERGGACMSGQPASSCWQCVLMMAQLPVRQVHRCDHREQLF